LGGWQGKNGWLAHLPLLMADVSLDLIGKV